MRGQWRIEGAARLEKSRHCSPRAPSLSSASGWQMRAGTGTLRHSALAAPVRGMALLGLACSALLVACSSGERSGGHPSEDGGVAPDAPANADTGTAAPASADARVDARTDASASADCDSAGQWQATAACSPGTTCQGGRLPRMGADRHRRHRSRMCDNLGRSRQVLGLGGRAGACQAGALAAFATTDHSIRRQIQG